MICIREERPVDIENVRKLNEKAFTQAFGQAPEADLVDRLRENCSNILSLVAVQNDQVIGHIYFSPVNISGDKIIEGIGLGPMAVLPEFQRRGIGSQLVQAGIEILKRRGYTFIIVLGHPEYYPRFGFKRASHSGIRSQWARMYRLRRASGVRASEVLGCWGRSTRAYMASSNCWLASMKPAPVY